MAAKAIGEIARVGVPIALNALGQIANNMKKRRQNRSRRYGPPRRRPRAPPVPSRNTRQYRNLTKKLGGGVKTSVPYSQGLSRYGKRAPTRRENGSDQTLDVGTKLTSQVFEEAGADTIHPLFINPGDHINFPRLYHLSSQYTQFRFGAMSLVYSPQCGAETKGTLYLAFVSDCKVVERITTAADLQCLPNFISGPVWQTISLNVPSSAMSLAYNTFRSVSGTAVDFTDSTQNQGAFLWTLVGGSLSDGSIYGVLQPKYDITLMNPQLDVSSSAFGFGLTNSGADTTTSAYPLSSIDLNEVGGYHRTMVDVTAGAGYDRVTFNSHAPLVVFFRAKVTTASYSAWTINFNNCTATTVLTENTVDGTNTVSTRLYHLVPNSSLNITCDITNAGTLAFGAAGDFRLMAFTTHRETFTESVGGLLPL